MERRIGFIGIGEMGFPMVRNLLKAGYKVNVYDSREEPLLEMKKHGAVVVRSPKEIVQSSEIILCMVRTGNQLETVFRGKEGLLEGSNPDAIVVIMSTVEPRIVQELSELTRAKGIKLLDAPVSGARQGAEKATLTIMAGGPRSAYEECLPIFESLGKGIFYFGDVGMGEVAKLVNNHLVLINMLGVYEAFNLAEVAGVKMDVLLEMIKVSTGNSWIVEHWDLVKSWKEETERVPTPGSQFKDIKTLYKDIQITLNCARDLNVSLPLAGVSSQLGWD
jgi:3-hydroxyisobutyrate dehydrogenase-like beta-hydroxyacid dehydrogenase